MARAHRGIEDDWREWDDVPLLRASAPRTGRRAGIGEAAAKGALAGMIGGAAMMMAMKVEQKAFLPEGQTMEPPPRKLVETLAEKADVELDDQQAKMAGMGVHMGNSALWGALFGVVQDRVHPPSMLHGLLLGGLVYAANFPSFGLLPRLGVLPPPSQQPLREAAIPVGAHVVYGIATAAAFEAMT
ncbi:MAG TPA: DUF1440 domain-containing protein [Longimicrobiaceae bacterium]|nr:DUF1440 domain-containing protein [Longimicrobiaceae bacterium]